MIDSELKQSSYPQQKDHTSIDLYSAYIQNSTQPKSDEKSEDFQMEYIRLYIANVVLTQQLKELLQEKSELMVRVSKLENKSGDNQKENQFEDQSYEDRKHRLRRTANEISRHYICPVKDCQKSYGSEGSLNQHLKLKHRKLLYSQRESSNDYENKVDSYEEQDQKLKRN